MGSSENGGVLVISYPEHEVVLAQTGADSGCAHVSGLCRSAGRRISSARQVALADAN